MQQVFDFPHLNEYRCRITHKGARFSTSPDGYFVFTASLSKSQKRTNFKFWVRHQNPFLLINGEKERTWSEQILDPNFVENRLKELHAEYLELYESVAKKYEGRVLVLRDHFSKVMTVVKNPDDLSTDFNINVQGIGDFKGRYVPNQPPPIILNVDGIKIQLAFDKTEMIKLSTLNSGTFDLAFTPLPEQQQHARRLAWTKTGGSSTMTCPDSVKNDGLANSIVSCGGYVEDFKKNFLDLTTHKVARTNWQIPSPP